jgi:hypothetical protein
VEKAGYGMKLTMIFCTQMYSKWRENLASWGKLDHQVLVVNQRPLTYAYQLGYEKARDADILGYVHDDVTCYDENWKEKVLAEFDDPAVGLVGFGGSSGHGDAEIYKKPYDWQQVGREGRFMSNLINAELHGSRINTPQDASFCDGFALFVRRKILDQAGGWPQGTPIAYWSYDMWISCETRRQGYKIRVVPVSCEHTCPVEYRSYIVDEDIRAAHKWLYDNYSDTFPARV